MPIIVCLRTDDCMLAGYRYIDTMPKTIQVPLTPDEIELLVDALEADREGYQEAAKEARGNSRASEMRTYTEAADRITAMMAKLQGFIEA